MKKPYPFHALSDEACHVQTFHGSPFRCMKPIKKNVAERKLRRPLVCYRHWLAAQRARVVERS